MLVQQVEGVVYDPQSNMSLCSHYATQTALKDRVAVVMGGVTSANRETIRPIFHRFETLYLCNTQYEGGVCDCNEITIGTIPAQTVARIIPYFREIMDTLSPRHPAQRISFMKAAQVGATEAGNNWIGFVIHHAPNPTLAVLATVKMAKRSSRGQLDPLIA